MEFRLPSHEELVDLSWLLDSAVVSGQRARAVDFATRLVEALLRYRDGVRRSRPAGGATIAARPDACSTMLAHVTSVLAQLDRGDTVRPTQFRHEVEALATEPNHEDQAA